MASLHPSNASAVVRGATHRQRLFMRSLPLSCSLKAFGWLHGALRYDNVD